jgi:hypothetical protein
MVTAAQMRKLALSMPEAEEKSHFGQPDFRVRNKIFAGLSPDGMRGTLKLSLEVQSVVVEAKPEVFFPAAGAWGRGGWTHVDLARVKLGELEELVDTAWRLVAPKRLLAARDDRAPRDDGAGRAAGMKWEALCKLGRELPEVVEDIWFRTPALKVRGKSFVRLKEDGQTVVFLLESVGEQEFLIESQPAIYYITGHYRGYPAVLARLSALGPSECRLRLERAWRLKAPKALLKQLDGVAPAEAPRRRGK